MASKKRMGARPTVFARKSKAAKDADVPPEEPAVRPPAEVESRSYDRYLVFVDDPHARCPFATLDAKKIVDIKRKEDLDKSFLNNARRKRPYDIAFTSVYKFSCRVFAKVEPSYSTLKLNKIVSDLNTQYRNLLACNVDVEKAYATLLESKARKVKAGICYDTGRVTNKRTANKYPDTPSSYTDTERETHTPRSGQADAHSEKEGHSDSNTDLNNSSDSSALSECEGGGHEGEDHANEEDVSRRPFEVILNSYTLSRPNASMMVNMTMSVEVKQPKNSTVRSRHTTPLRQTSQTSSRHRQGTAPCPFLSLMIRKVSI